MTNDILISREKYDPTAEITAVLSILKEDNATARHLVASTHKQPLRYMVLLWVVGKVVMPPYLPRIIGKVRAGSRAEILERLNSLVEQYEQDCEKLDLNEDDAIKIRETVTGIGDNISKYIRPVGDCLEALARSRTGMGIKNLIIHTDEYMIPWHLATSDYPSEEYDSSSLDADFDFLCNKYSCGTILVDDAEENAFPRFIRRSQRSKPPDITELSEKYIFLVAGEVGHLNDEGSDLGLVYIEELKRRLEADPDCKMQIRCFSVLEWIRNGRDPISEFKLLLKRGQIIHFTGHFVDGKMVLAKSLKPIGHEELEDLPDLKSKPLIVLHGCSSAGSAGHVDAHSAQVYKAFLNRGAGGCLATVLSVNIATKPSEASEGLIEI